MYIHKVKKARSAFIIYCAVVFLLISSGLAIGKNSSTYMTEKLVPVVTQTPDIHIYPFSIKLSKDGEHIAYVVNNKQTNKMIACLDGKCSKPWEKITEDSPILSSDGRHMAFVGHDGENVHLVLDGKAGEEFKTINDVRFSDDNQHLIYWAEKFGKVFIVLDNAKKIKVDEILDLTFSPDSKNIGYSARISDKWYAFINGRRSPAFDKVIDVKFSPDSKHFAYLAYDKPVWNAIVDGKRKKYWGARMGNLVFSPDSSQSAYAFYRYDNMAGKTKPQKGVWRMAINEVAGPELDEKYNLFLYSPDSKHFAYIAGKPGKQYVYMDGEKKSEEYLTIKYIKFSPDSKHFLYVPIQSDGKFVVIMDERKHASYEYIAEPVFSSNSKILSYVAVEEKGSKKQRMVINGKEEKEYEKIGIPFFSPDGNHYAYAAMKDDEWCIVYDGKEQNFYERVGIGNFDESSKHIAYTAFKNGKWFVVVDGHEGRVNFDSRKLPNAYLYSNAPAHFTLLIANRENKNIEFYNLEIKVNE